MIEQQLPEKLLLASPRGFCAGVKRALTALNETVQTYPDQAIYCYHQIVHNWHVVKDFEAKGVKFVSSLEEVPAGSILVFSSHGVSPALRLQAMNQKLRTIDATCPFVTKTHLEVKKYASDGDKIVYIGQPNHDEALGTTGEAPEATTIVQTEEEINQLDFSPLTTVALVTQTTLSFDETDYLKETLRAKFPRLIEPAHIDICMATQNRQLGVKEMVKQGAQVVVVLGSANSSNSNKLRKVAEKEGAKAVLVDEITQVDPGLLADCQVVGLTAGASLPEAKVAEAIAWFKNQGTQEVEEVVVADESQVNLPPVKIL